MSLCICLGGPSGSVQCKKPAEAVPIKCAWFQKPSLPSPPFWPRGLRPKKFPAKGSAPKPGMLAKGSPPPRPGMLVKGSPPKPGSIAGIPSLSPSDVVVVVSTLPSGPRTVFSVTVTRWPLTILVTVDVEVDIPPPPPPALELKEEKDVAPVGKPPKPCLKNGSSKGLAACCRLPMPPNRMSSNISAKGSLPPKKFSKISKGFIPPPKPCIPLEKALPRSTASFPPWS
mmetsp:Transcript_62359/g.115746  ORF Transcript_62359/g.115746 Transcript_62359/m.115746 type:complete len:228 (+) Transcript_62359:36-719(+)